MKEELRTFDDASILEGNITENGTLFEYDSTIGEKKFQPIETTIVSRLNPISGSPGPGIFGLMLSLDDIEALIPKLREASSELKTLWKNTLSGSVAKIENSWAGDDAKVYVDNVQALAPKVDNVCQAIDLLANTYQKVLDKSRDTKTSVIKTISSRINSVDGTSVRLG